MGYGGKLIGKGRIARVYRVDSNEDSYARKEYHPTLTANLLNGIFYNSPHPLSTSNGQKHAYWKRRLASRLGEYLDDNVEIVDALETSSNGFMSRFIEGEQPTRHEIKEVHRKFRRLEDRFDIIGMPTWSFSSRNPFADSNFIIGNNGKTYVIDYEQSIPAPDARGRIDYDTVYVDDVNSFLAENRHGISDRLGIARLSELEEALEGTKHHQEMMDLIQKKGVAVFCEKFAKPLSKLELERTVEGLYADGRISKEEFDSYQSGETGEHIKHAITNLAVHMAMGLSTPPGFTLVGGIGLVSPFARASWTAGNFMYYTLKGDYGKRRIHHPRVMLITSIPLLFPLSAISNGAYILSIMNESPEIGLAMCENLLKEFTGKGLEETLKSIGSRKYLGRLAHAYERMSHAKAVSFAQRITLGKNAKKAHDIILNHLTGEV